MNLILSSRGQLLTASLSQCWSQLANEVGNPRAANDILLPVSSVSSSDENSVWESNLGAVLTAMVRVSSDGPCPATPPLASAAQVAPVALSPRSFPREQQSLLIDLCCMEGGGGAEEGAGVRKGSDSICFVPGSKQRGYCLLIDCF